MAGLTAGGVPVYRDSAGVLRDSQELVTTDNAAAMLPAGEFTAEQREMARLPLPFRNIIRDPFRPDIGSDPKTTAYPEVMAQAIAAKCSSFRIINPNNCPMRFRGATGLTDVIKDGEGRLLGPWQTEVFSTQNPTHLSVMFDPSGDMTIPASPRRPELNYGIGG